MVDKDLFGQALHDYWYKQASEDMLTWTHLTEPEILPTAYLFRNFDLMPKVEQLALQTASGQILDVGAGSGTHSLWLQNKGEEVTALELSELSCRLMTDRGIKNVIQDDFFKFRPDQTFDTILFLMNGVGIVQRAQNLDRLFIKLKQILSPEGQALIHSSDLKYLFESPEGYLMPSKEYYGDVDFFIGYKNQVEQINWTYIDENTLRIFAQKHGFRARTLYTSDENDFLISVKFT